MSTEVKEVFIFKTYHPSQQKANRKYYENNKKEIYDRARERHLQKVKEDPEYYEKFKERQRLSYHKRKDLKKSATPTDTNI